MVRPLAEAPRVVMPVGRAVGAAPEGLPAAMTSSAATAVGTSKVAVVLVMTCRSEPVGR